LNNEIRSDAADEVPEGLVSETGMSEALPAGDAGETVPEVIVGENLSLEEIPEMEEAVLPEPGETNDPEVEPEMVMDVVPDDGPVPEEIPEEIPAEIPVEITEEKPLETEVTEASVEVSAEPESTEVQDTVDEEILSAEEAEQAEEQAETAITEPVAEEMAAEDHSGMNDKTIEEVATVPESVEPAETVPGLEQETITTSGQIPPVDGEEQLPEADVKESAAPAGIPEKSRIADQEQEEEEFLEKTEPGEEHNLEAYSGFTQIELVNMMREVVDGESPESGHRFEVLVAAYYRKTREYNEDLKKKFIAEGGTDDDFVSEEDPYKNDVKELLKKYRLIRGEQARRLDAEKEVNLQKKYEIIEDIKNLLNKEESINRTFQEFRELQKRWYEIGQVPQAKMKDLWDTYHFHVENFYDYIKINKELRDLDLRKNLEAKIEICEKAEELLVEPSIIKAFNSLQKFHEEWREIGPVPTDKKDEIWERFKAATSKINQKHQEYFEKRKSDQKKNLDAKVALCEKAEEISAADYDTHRDWEEKSRELVELQKVWKTIGFAPKKENNRIYDRFRAACDKFFINKREFYSKNKDYQQTNLQMKIDLCLEAENLKESTDWKKATQQFIDIQKRWKEIGAVPRKNSDAIWKRFRAACDYFFERKAGHFNDIDEEQAENLKQKEKLIAEVENFTPDNDPAASLKILREFQRRWTEIGHVPLKNKDAVQHRFREAIDKQFDALKIDHSNRNVFNFRSKIESMTDNARGLSKVRSEREKYMIKLKQLENDLILLDNNIGFFANSKNAQALIADVNQKIRDTREKIEQLKEKIRIIDDLDKSEY
jgi:hypothetical protein